MYDEKDQYEINTQIFPNFFTKYDNNDNGH